MTDSLRLGFVIARNDETLPWDKTRRYRGLNRLPWTMNPFSPIGGELGRAWSEYEDAWDEGRIRRDRVEAERLCGALVALGENLEVIYADVVQQPLKIGGVDDSSWDSRKQRLERFVASCARVPPPPADFETLGLDVTSPIPSFHSAIFQPGLGFSPDEVGTAHLNGNGLIDDSDLGYAIDLMNAANETGYLQSVFHVVRIRSALRT